MATPPLEDTGKDRGSKSRASSLITARDHDSAPSSPHSARVKNQRTSARKRACLIRGVKYVRKFVPKMLEGSLDLVPINARKLRPTTVHQVELVVDAREHLGDGGAVGDHAAGPHHLPSANPAGWDSEKC